MNGSHIPRRSNSALSSMFRRRLKWRGGWLRPRVRWGVLAVLGAAMFAAAASANVLTITTGAVTRTTHVVHHLFSGNTGSAARASERILTPADDEYGTTTTTSTTNNAALTVPTTGTTGSSGKKGDKGNKGGSSSGGGVLTPPTSGQLDISESPGSQTVPLGGNAKFTITVTNTGGVTLHDVSVDPPVSDCDQKIGTLAPKDGLTYTCHLVGVTEKLVNTATAIGYTPAGTKVTARTKALVKVSAPPPAPQTQVQTLSLALTKLPRKQVVTTKVVHIRSKTGSQHTTVLYGYAWFTITVKNTSHVALSNVIVRNPKSPGCDRRIARLAPGAVRSYRCFAVAVRDQLANAVASGTAKTGKSVKANAHAAVIVHIKTVNSGSVEFAG
jgi:hypothetical protein